jgi:hypothetical protein
MEIRLNANWTQAQQRLEAFWQNEIIDRPCLPVYVTPPETRPTIPDPRLYYTDPQTFFAVEREKYLAREYLGEAFPAVYTPWRVLPVLLGAEYECQPETIWYHPLAHSLDEINLASFSPDHPAVLHMEELLATCAFMGTGECFITYPPLANSDEPAILLGYSQYCIDLIEQLETALRLECQLTEIWKVLYDRFTQATNQHIPGSCSWLPAWHPGRAALIEFDLGGMISPRHFKRFLPYLLERACYADRAIYHLDGPGALAHLDTLLGLPELDAIQWEPGAGGGSFLNWIPVMQRIQAAGKGLYVGYHGVSTAEAMVLLNALRPEGLILPVNVSSREEGLRFLETVERRYHRL